MAVGKTFRAHPVLSSVVLFLALFYAVSRLGALGGKPYHHDESIHAVESWKYARHGQYRFDPMLHGPFLYHVQAAIFEVCTPRIRVGTICEVDDTTGRLSMALMSLAIPLFGWFALQGNRTTRLIWFGLAALSPLTAYYNRYLAMDTPMIFLALGFLAAALRFFRTGRALYFHLAVAAVALAVCTKLNFLFYGFSFLTFFLIPKALPHAEIRSRLKNLRWHWVWGFLLFAAVFCLLYSSLGRNPAGIADALYRKMLPYWVGQHRAQRIKGPFDYYLWFFALYELPLLFCLAWSAFRAAAASRRSVRLTWGWLGGVAAVYAVCRWQWDRAGGLFAKLFHFDQAHHPAVALLEVGIWALAVRFHLRRGQTLAAFAAHWGFSSLLAYSYAGEKVPWLGTHIVVPFAVYAASVLPSLYRTVSGALRPALLFFGAVLAAWQGYITLQAVFRRAADPKEYLIYTHTSRDMVDLVRRTERLARRTGAGKEFAIQVQGDSAWPLYWYFRDYKRWFYPTLELDRQPGLVVVDWGKEKSPAESLPGYAMERMKLREWWVPDARKADWRDFLAYYFTREVFSPTGSQDVTVFVRPDLLPGWRESAVRAD